MRKRRRLKKKVRYALHLMALTLVLLVVGITYIQKQHNSTAATSPVQKSATQSTSRSKQVANTKIKLQADWQSILKQTDSPVQIAVYDSSTQETYTATNQKKETFTTASTVKVAILAGILHNHQEAGTKLSSTEKTNAQAMIQQSDNDAATAMFQTLGSFTGLNQVFNDLGMTQTNVATGWAFTTTTASDQLKLLNTIFYGSTYLSDTSRSYIKQLMNQVASDQQWGISAGSSTFQLKNGWRLDSDNTWTVNSIGHVGAAQGGYTIATFTKENASLKKGQTLVENLAKATAKDLD